MCGPTASASVPSSILDGSTRLASLLRRERYDVVHAHSPVVASMARLEVRALARAHRPAFVYTEHNRWPSYRVETRYANQLTFGLNDAVFAVSDDVRDSVSVRHRHDVEVLVHGVDVDAGPFVPHRTRGDAP